MKQYLLKQEGKIVFQKCIYVLQNRNCVLCYCIACETIMSIPFELLCKADNFQDGFYDDFYVWLHNSLLSLNIISETRGHTIAAVKFASYHCSLFYTSLHLDEPIKLPCCLGLVKKMAPEMLSSPSVLLKVI